MGLINDAIKKFKVFRESWKNFREAKSQVSLNPGHIDSPTKIITRQTTSPSDSQPQTVRSSNIVDNLVTYLQGKIPAQIKLFMGAKNPSGLYGKYPNLIESILDRRPDDGVKIILDVLDKVDDDKQLLIQDAINKNMNYFLRQLLTNEGTSGLDEWINNYNENLPKDKEEKIQQNQIIMRELEINLRLLSPNSNAFQKIYNLDETFKSPKTTARLILAAIEQYDKNSAILEIIEKNNPKYEESLDEALSTLLNDRNKDITKIEKIEKILELIKKTSEVKYKEKLAEAVNKIAKAEYFSETEAKFILNNLNCIPFQKERDRILQEMTAEGVGLDLILEAQLKTVFARTESHDIKGLMEGMKDITRRYSEYTKESAKTNKNVKTYLDIHSTLEKADHASISAVKNPLYHLLRSKEDDNKIMEMLERCYEDIKHIHGEKCANEMAEEVIEKINRKAECIWKNDDYKYDQTSRESSYLYVSSCIKDKGQSVQFLTDKGGVLLNDAANRVSNEGIDKVPKNKSSKSLPTFKKQLGDPNNGQGVLVEPKREEGGNRKRRKGPP